MKTKMKSKQANDRGSRLGLFGLLALMVISFGMKDALAEGKYWWKSNDKLVADFESEEKLSEVVKLLKEKKYSEVASKAKSPIMLAKVIHGALVDVAPNAELPFDAKLLKEELKDTGKLTKSQLETIVNEVIDLHKNSSVDSFKSKSILDTKVFTADLRSELKIRNSAEEAAHKEKLAEEKKRKEDEEARRKAEEAARRARTGEQNPDLSASAKAIAQWCRQAKALADNLAQQAAKGFGLDGKIEDLTQKLAQTLAQQAQQEVDDGSNRRNLGQELLDSFLAQNQQTPATPAIQPAVPAQQPVTGGRRDRDDGRFAKDRLATPTTGNPQPQDYESTFVARTNPPVTFQSLPTIDVSRMDRIRTALQNIDTMETVDSVLSSINSPLAQMVPGFAAFNAGANLANIVALKVAKEGEIRKLQPMLSSLDREVSDVKDKLTAIEGQVQKLLDPNVVAAVNAMEKDLKNRKAQMDGEQDPGLRAQYKKDFNFAQAELESYKTDIQTAAGFKQSDIAQLQNQLKRAEETKDNMMAAIGKLKGEVVELKKAQDNQLNQQIQQILAQNGQKGGRLGDKLGGGVAAQPTSSRGLGGGTSLGAGGVRGSLGSKGGAVAPR